MLDKYFNKLQNTYNELGFFNNKTVLNNRDILLRTYLYYQYYNADDTKLDDVEDIIVNNLYIEALYQSELEEDHIDFLKVVQCKDKNLNIDLIKDEVENIDKYLIDLFNGNKGNIFDGIRSLFLSKDISSENQFNFILLVNSLPDFDTKASIKEYVTNYNSKLGNINFIIFFADDILEIINDVESPSLFVKKAGFLLTDKDQFLFHGKEKSLVTSISAKSLKDVYVKYGTKGLFSSNLRYYVKSAKIDSSIKESIIKEPEKFWYFNNGLIITCEDYSIKNNKIELTNFSIVNGGQTTNLIGNTIFETDFSVICKIIRNKYEDKKTNTEFLGKVAETSNTQKPIKSRDLISNRIEQKNLHEQFYEMGVFLEIKRGQKINKELYPERWQNAKNDEVGQMLFSMIYQHPGIARNSKTKMLENDNYYNIIYRSQYNSVLLLSLQHFKVGYNKWLSKIKKLSYQNNKVGLAKNGFLTFLATIGFIAKLYYNEDFQEIIYETNNSTDFTTDALRSIISQNDIGQLGVFKQPELLSDTKSIDFLLDFVYENFILPAYLQFKNQNPSVAYSNFTKNDTNYYRTIIPVIAKKFRLEWKTLRAELDTYFDSSDEYIVGLQEISKVFEEHKPGLSEELTEYRKYKYNQGQYKIKAYEIFTNNNRSKIVHFKPRTKNDLIKDCGLTSFSVENYGEDILKIVDKYIIK